MKGHGWSLLGTGLVVPWCCIAPAALSLLGITGLSLGLPSKIEAALFPYLAILAVVLLGRAHWLLAVRRQGNRASRIVTWGSTGLASVLIGFRLWT